MRVIASSLRKGNIVDLDGRLYVVMTADNIHPGKGTPVTQLDLRRLSDGVKVSQRYKTTEQVERAFVEDRDYQFLYHDGDGFHFMNAETYDQVTVPADIIGDQTSYLQPEMKVKLSMHEGVPVGIELPHGWCSKSSKPSPPSRVRPRPRPINRLCFPTAGAPWCRPISRPAPASW